MWYHVKAEFVEENIAGKPMEEIISWIEMVIHPSLEMIEEWIQDKKLVGGIIAGERVGVFLLEASSHEEVGMMLRSLPFWGAMRWAVAPLQTPRSAIEQDKEAFVRAKEMMAKMDNS